MKPVLAITGVTGAVGGAVARLLTQDGLSLRLLLRDPSKLPALRQSEADTEVAVADYGAADVEQALEGIETLFMVSAAEDEHRLAQHRNFVDAAQRAGVRHIVYTSFLGASADCTFTLGRDHFATEEHIKATSMRWTFLRDSFYADAFEMFAGPDRIIAGPGGNGRVAPVTRADVARAAAEVLSSPGKHEGRVYNLTGPKALSLAHIAQTLTAVRGVPYRYVDQTMEEARASRAVYNVPNWQLDAWVSTYQAIANGDCDVVSEDVAKITGQIATSYEEFLQTTPAPVFN